MFDSTVDFLIHVVVLVCIILIVDVVYCSLVMKLYKTTISEDFLIAPRIRFQRIVWQLNQVMSVYFRSEIVGKIELRIMKNIDACTP